MRRVDCADATVWLRRVIGAGPVVASLPDAHEVHLDPAVWANAFARWADECFAAAAGAPVVFVQTDRKAGGVWHSKPAIIAAIAGRRRVPLRWHKIALRREPGATDLHRPGYTHVVAYGGDRPGRPFADVWPAGRRLWANGTPVGVAARVIEWLDEAWPAGPVVNPFCGLGTFLAAANDRGREAWGCDVDADLVARAQEVLL